MSPKRLPIPTCQRIVTWERDRNHPLPVARHCGAPSVAVNAYPDGREQFVCKDHDDAQLPAGPAWATKRRGPAALSM